MDLRQYREWSAFRPVLEFTANEEDKGKRIDLILINRYPYRSRSFFQKLIKDGKITVNNKQIRSSCKIHENDFVSVDLEEQYKDFIIPPLPFESVDILYEDDYILALNKPRGIIVHPAGNEQFNTLLNVLDHQFKGREFSLHTCHRLDRDTTGIIIFAKSPGISDVMRTTIKSGKFHKTYLTLVYGSPEKDRGFINSPISQDSCREGRPKMVIDQNHGKKALTEYETIKKWDGFSLLKIILHTGRRHQIRIHLHSIGIPVVSDPVYCNLQYKIPHKYRQTIFNNIIEKVALHAFELSFIHPCTKNTVNIKAPIPQDFQNFMNYLDLTI